MSTLTWITDKELQREIKTKGDQFRRKKNKNFIAAVRKRGNASCCEQEHIQDFLIKTCN